MVKIGSKGIAILFSNGNRDQDYSIVFMAGVDDEMSVMYIVAKAKDDGFKAVQHRQVTYTEMGWRRREIEPSLRQLLGFRPAWKVA